jgi:hypothetical protein
MQETADSSCGNRCGKIPDYLLVDGTSVLWDHSAEVSMLETSYRASNEAHAS